MSNSCATVLSDSKITSTLSVTRISALHRPARRDCDSFGGLHSGESEKKVWNERGKEEVFEMHCVNRMQFVSWNWR